MIVLLISFTAFLLAALAIVALRPLTGPAFTWFALHILEIVFIFGVTADQIFHLLADCWRGLRALVRGRPHAGRIAAETLPFEEWTLRLCHHDEVRGSAALLASVDERLAVLSGPDTALACPRDGITTERMRIQVADWANGLRIDDDQEVNVRVPRRLPVLRNRITETGSFFFLWLAALAAFLLSTASYVADWERAACRDSCADRPATYASALEWVAYRLLWQEPPGLAAGTFFARSTGLMIGLLLLVTAMIAAAATIRYAGYRNQLRQEHRQRMHEIYHRNRILLVVATPVEREAVLRQARQHGVAESVCESAGVHPVHRLGVIGGTEVLLAQVGQGATGPVSTAYSLPGILDEWRPDFVIMLGVCFGLDEGRQRLGDVIVAEQLQVIRLRVGATASRDRGDKTTAGHRLVEVFRVMAPPSGFGVWTGLLLSWDVLVDSARLLAELKDRYPDALGGEMEGSGVYASSARAGAEWIVVKGICDWGRDKDSDAQELAAGNAAKVVLDLIAAGALMARPDRNRRGWPGNGLGVR
ncbi:hypothetical protein AB0M36_09700 [Actinoplanes sp. NPDC051346]|uniref:phosphorylase family protein n=1 Tax=Actinoplanes sp. NPDC051346 TaxID=3155048 RepID=UPI0034464BEB